MWYFVSTSTDPCFNLALEEHLFRRLPCGESLFMLWQNDRTVVIGRYQNTIQEIDRAFVAEHDIRVVRRLSGGGTVYHDLGNLNFSFLTDAGPDSGIEFQPYCRPVIDVLKGYGVHATLSGRNDMLIDGKKFSGNAQYRHGGRLLHHGTLLFRSDLSMIQGTLRVKGEKILSKGVRSVASRVTNITDHLPETVTLEQFQRDLLAAMGTEQTLVPYALSKEELDDVFRLREEKYCTWEWNYGRSPRHQILKQGYFEGCGSIQASISVADGGAIEAIEFFGDFFSSEDLNGLTFQLVGLPYRYDDLVQALSRCDVARYIHAANPIQLTHLLID